MLLSSCQFGSSFQYVSHRSPDGLDLYFKVPAHWSTFDTKEIIEAENGKRGPTQLKQIAAGDWLEAMSSRPDVTAKESDRLGQRYPAAVVQVQQLGGEARDVLAIIDGRPGPFIDGRRYHTDEFLEVAEDYHRRIVEAHKGRGVEQLTLPVLPGLSIQEPVELVNSFADQAPPTP